MLYRPRCAALLAALTTLLISSAATAQEPDDSEVEEVGAPQPPPARVTPPPIADSSLIPPSNDPPPETETSDETQRPTMTRSRALDPAKPGAEPVNASDVLRALHNDDRSFRSGRWSYRFGGYVRTTYSAIENDPQIPLFGRNDGFILANARPYIIGAMDNGLGFSLQLELAAGLDRPGSILPNQEVLARPRDAYIFYAPFSFLEIQAGVFRPPHDAESLLPTNNMLFIRRSVGADGIQPHEGFQTPGLAFDRDVGLQLTGTHFFMAEEGKREGLGVFYAAALTNGTNAARTLNDNDSLALWGRVALLWGDHVRLGVGYLYNDATLGEPPDLVGERRAGWTADLMVQFAGLTMFSSYTTRTFTTEFGQAVQGQEEPFTTATAFQAQAGYLIPVVHLQPVYRFATYDPSAKYNIDNADDFRTRDALTQHTIGLNYIAQDYPVMVMVDYTVMQEQAGRELDNNRFEVLLQLTW
jgi:hypothetical protein